MKLDATDSTVVAARAAGQRVGLRIIHRLERIRSILAVCVPAIRKVATDEMDDRYDPLMSAAKLLEEADWEAYVLTNLDDQAVLSMHAPDDDDETFVKMEAELASLKGGAR